MKRKGADASSEQQQPPGKRARREQQRSRSQSQQLREAVESGHWERVAQLRDAGAALDIEDIVSDILSAREEDRLPIIHRLTRHFPRVDAAGAWTSTMTHIRDALSTPYFIADVRVLTLNGQHCPCQMPDTALNAMCIISPRYVFNALEIFLHGRTDGHPPSCGFAEAVGRLRPPETYPQRRYHLDKDSAAKVVVRGVLSEGLFDLLPRLLGDMPQRAVPGLDAGVAQLLRGGRVDLLPLLLEKMRGDDGQDSMKEHLRDGLAHAFGKRRWDLASWLARRLTAPALPPPLKEEGGVGLEEALGRVTDPRGKALLFREACRAGVLPVVDTLLRGTRRDRNFAREHMRSAICRAATNGHLDVLKYFFDRNLAFGRLGNAAIGAARRGHLDVLKYLLDRNLTSEQLGKAAIGAARHGRLDVLRFLFDHDATCSVTELIEAAAAGGNPEVVQLTQDRRAPLEHHVNCWLAAAAAAGSLSVVKAALDKLAEPERQRRAIIESSAIRRAAWVGCIETVRSLLSVVDAHESPPPHFAYETALVCAIERGFVDVVTLLLEHGATGGSSTFVRLCDMDTLAVLLRHYLPRVSDPSERRALLSKLYHSALDRRDKWCFYKTSDCHYYEVAYMLETRWPDYCGDTTSCVPTSYQGWKRLRQAREVFLVVEILPCREVVNLILSYGVVDLSVYW